MKWGESAVTICVCVRVNVMGIPTASCMVYMVVHEALLEANRELIRVCVQGCKMYDQHMGRPNSWRFTRTFISGQFRLISGHNGDLLMQLAESLHLNIAGLDLGCKGQLTWCTWGRATCK